MKGSLITYVSSAGQVDRKAIVIGEYVKNGNTVLLIKDSKTKIIVRISPNDVKDINSSWLFD